MSHDKVLCLWRTFLSKIVIQGSWNIKIWPSFKDCILKWSKIDLALKTLVSSRSPSKHKQVRTNWCLLMTRSTRHCQSGEQDDDAVGCRNRFHNINIMLAFIRILEWIHTKRFFRELSYFSDYRLKNLKNNLYKL